MSNYCTKEFTLHVAAAATWTISDGGFGNDPGFTGDADSASWDVGNVSTSYPANWFPNPPPWHDAFTQYLGGCVAGLNLGPYPVNKDFSLSITGTLTSNGSKPGWTPPDFGAASVDVKMTNLVGYSGDYVQSTGGNSTLPYTTIMTGTLPAGLICGITVTMIVDGIDAASLSVGSLTITVVDA